MKTAAIFVLNLDGVIERTIPVRRNGDTQAGPIYSPPWATSCIRSPASAIVLPPYSSGEKRWSVNILNALRTNIMYARGIVIGRRRPRHLYAGRCGCGLAALNKHTGTI